MVNIDGMVGKVEELAIKAAPYAGFVLALTESDIGANWSSLPLTQKMELVANMVGGRTVGFNPFPNAGATYPPQFKLGGALNKYTGIGLIVYGAAEVGLIPSKFKGAGKQFALGAAIGGLFDPVGAPVNGNVNYRAPQNPMYAGGQRAPLRGVAPNAAYQAAHEQMGWMPADPSKNQWTTGR